MLGYEMLKTERSLIYILTLGVIKPYRNCGIASALVWEVIHYASRISTCRAVYLHVISYNQSAIHFYQKNMFHCLRRLHNFYCIEGRFYDAYLYVYYVNGGRSPCSAVYPQHLKYGVLCLSVDNVLCLLQRQCYTL
jgi:ribosomal protein S18 acetylase RimI-like enzyme